MKFKVGDVCVIVRGDDAQLRPSYERFLGMEVTVSGPLEPEGKHEVQGPDGLVLGVQATWLRLMRPPSWDRWIYDTSGIEEPSNARQIYAQRPGCRLVWSEL